MGVYEMRPLISGVGQLVDNLPPGEGDQLRVLPVDLSNFVYEIQKSNSLFVDQTRSICFDADLVVPFLDVLIDWLAERKVRPLPLPHTILPATRARV